MADISIEERWIALSSCRLPNFPAVTHFGRAPDGYDLGGIDGQGIDPEDDADDYGDGAPGIMLVEQCVAAFAQSWRRFDVRTAASVFNIAEELIEQVAPDQQEIALPLAGIDIGYLIQLTAMGQENTTIAEVAALLNLPEQMVAKAVERHSWIYAGAERDGSPIIEHDGE